MDKDQLSPQLGRLIDQAKAAALRAASPGAAELRGEGGGSPGEWIVERMDELETELDRRKKAKKSG